MRLTARGRQLDAAVRVHSAAAERELARELGEDSFRELYDMLLKIAELPRERARNGPLPVLS